MLSAALILTALLAGAAGSWSPCGFSMVETLAPRREDGRARASAPALAAFALGALLGGAATFAGLSTLGAWLGIDGATPALAAAAAVALLAALADALDLPVLPQVRRQVPESWRRLMPLPLAGGLYGVLLGLGFTTFVLACSVWALMVLALAGADPATGLAIGAAFGAGRAVPVLAFASSRPERAGELLGDRPGLLRGLRGATAAALAAALLALALGGAPASAASVATPGATDPSIGATGAIAYHFPGSRAQVALPSPYGGPLQALDLPGTRAAAGGGHVAWLDPQGTITVASIADPATPLYSISVPGADAVAVSDRWLAWRHPSTSGGDVLGARPHDGSLQPFAFAVGDSSISLGRPALDGDVTVFHVTGRTQSRIRLINLVTRATSVPRSARSAQLLNPSLLGDRLLYVRSTARRQQLWLGGISRLEAEEEIYRIAGSAARDKGREPNRHPHPGGDLDPEQLPQALGITLWTTALGADRAYVTRLRRGSDGRTTADLLRVDL